MYIRYCVFGQLQSSRIFQCCEKQNVQCGIRMSKNCVLISFFPSFKTTLIQLLYLMLCAHMNWIISNLIKANSLFFVDCTQEEKNLNHLKASSPPPYPCPPNQNKVNQNKATPPNPNRQTIKLCCNSVLSRFAGGRGREREE